MVIAREVQRRIDRDERIFRLGTQLAEAEGAERTRLGARMDRLRGEVHSEKLGEASDEFDRIHSVERGVEVGSVHRIIRRSQLRPYLVDAVERGIRRETERRTGNGGE